MATLQAGKEAGMSAREYLNFAEAQRPAMGIEDVAGGRQGALGGAV